MKKILLSLLMIQSVQCMKEPAPLTPDEKRLIEVCESEDVDDHEAVKKLIEEKKVNINVTDEYGYTPALWAAFYGHDKALLVLAEHNADLDTADYAGYTPAIWAACNSHDQALLVLAENNADFDKANNNGKTPAHLAACWGHDKALKQLMKYDAILTTKNNENKTPWDIRFQIPRYPSRTEQIKDLLQFTQEPLLLKKENEQEKEKTSQETE